MLGRMSATDSRSWHGGSKVDLQSSLVARHKPGRLHWCACCESADCSFKTCKPPVHVSHTSTSATMSIFLAPLSLPGMAQSHLCKYSKHDVFGQTTGDENIAKITSCSIKPAFLWDLPHLSPRSA